MGLFDTEVPSDESPDPLHWWDLIVPVLCGAGIAFAITVLVLGRWW